MSVEKSIDKYFDDFRGVDITRSNIARGKEYAREMENCDFVGLDTIAKRKGSKVHSEADYGQGIHTHEYTDETTGETVEELIRIDKGTLYRLKEDGIIDITYVPASGGTDLEMKLRDEANGFDLILDDSNDTVTTINLGTGLESSPTTVSDVVSTINALSNFTCSISNGDGSAVAAAAFTLFGDQDWEVNQLVPRELPFSYWEQVDGEFDRGNRDQEDVAFVVPSFENSAGGVTFIAMNSDDSSGGASYVYDGLNLRRPGVPVPELISVTFPSVAGSIATGRYIYWLALVKKDNRGNIIEGARSEPQEYTNTVANRRLDVNYSLDGVSADFGIRSAVIDGTQTGTTFDVITGHTIEVGDVIYTYHNGSGEFEERTVTAVTATTITVDSSIGVIDGYTLSNNWRLAIYRTEGTIPTTGTFYDSFLVTEWPADVVTGGTLSYRDGRADANLGAQYVEPTKTPGLPPEDFELVKIVNRRLLGVRASEPSTVYYSELDEFENFPALNFFDVPGADRITAIVPDTANSFAVFKDHDHFNVVGDLETFFDVEDVSLGGYGCPSHASVVSLDKRRKLFISDIGPATLEAGVVDFTIGLEVFELFVNQNYRKWGTIGESEENKIVLSRITAVNDPTNKRIYFTLPKSEGVWNAAFFDIAFVAAAMGYTTSSYVLAYDTIFKRWIYPWKYPEYMIPATGWAVKDKQVYYLSEYVQGDPDAARVYRLLNNTNPYNEEQDYADNHKPITMKYKSGFIHNGEPSVFKLFSRLKLWMLKATRFITSFTVTVNIYKDYETSTVVSNKDMTFSSSTDTNKKMRIRDDKYQAISFEITNSTLHECPVINGVEIETSNPYDTEIKD